MIFSQRANLTTLEGDPRFFFDDSQTPQAQGTGTEEWGGGGDYWGGQTMTLPFAGHPTGARTPDEAKDKEDLIESEYRFLLADLMPFGKNARIQLEHGGTDESAEHYETVAYWYGLPSPSLVKTDELSVGDIESEKTHAYDSPAASAPVEITSRYEWGVDRLEGKEIYPGHTEVGRYTTGTSRSASPNSPRIISESCCAGRLHCLFCQSTGRGLRGEAAASSQPESHANWKLAGVWYLAGSNTCVYSNPNSELGTTEHRIEASNRRFRDDEFLCDSCAA